MLMPFHREFETVLLLRADGDFFPIVATLLSAGNDNQSVELFL